jgi:hypothetical protein
MSLMDREEIGPEPFDVLGEMLVRWRWEPELAGHDLERELPRGSDADEDTGATLLDEIGHSGWEAVIRRRRPEEGV